MNASSAKMWRRLRLFRRPRKRPPVNAWPLVDDIDLYDDRRIRDCATRMAELAGLTPDHAADFGAGWAVAPAKQAPSQPAPLTLGGKVVPYAAMNRADRPPPSPRAAQPAPARRRACHAAVRRAG